MIFKNILSQNKHNHPLLCLDGISSNEINYILDYIYHGEVKIVNDQLDRFLQVAQRFQLEGLMNWNPGKRLTNCRLHWSGSSDGRGQDGVGHFGL